MTFRVFALLKRKIRRSQTGDIPVSETQTEMSSMSLHEGIKKQRGVPVFLMLRVNIIPHLCTNSLVSVSRRSRRTWKDPGGSVQTWAYLQENYCQGPGGTWHQPQLTRGTRSRQLPSHSVQIWPWILHTLRPSPS